MGIASLKNKWKIGTCELPINEKTLIMGILNITPDSFSDGGKFNNIEVAVKRAKELVEHGADIIDIGGESTRPGYTQISVEEEIKRVVPVIEALTSEINVPISIDTYKSEVARASLQAGAHIINDIWGAKADANMAKVAVDFNAPIILMHNRDNMNYTNLISDMLEDLNESIQIVKAAGVTDDQIILDPGIGFAKTMEDNLKVMNHLDQITNLGYPVLLGTSRKRFIGAVLNDLPPAERMEGTGATVCLGIERGCSIMRVHDVKEIARMAKMMDAMMNKGGNHYR